MQQKLTNCPTCSKLSTIKSVTVNGERIKGCVKCLSKLKDSVLKEKRKIAREKKRETITEKKLDQIFSKLVRLIYPSICHSTLEKGEFKDFHCSHFIGRNNRCTRFDLRNCYPCFAAENMYNSLHVLELAKRLKEYYGIDYDDFISAAKQNTCKLNSNDRRNMYDVFQQALESIKEDSSLGNLEKLRFSVVEKTKLIM